MVLSRDSGLGLEELSSFQLNMLMANRIPHVLDLHVEELDQRVKLFYSITDKRMLSHWIRMRSLTMKQFYHLFHTIADTLSESGVYMLQEQNYVINEDYIYCGTDIADIYITYVPMASVEAKPVAVQLQQLASRLVHKVTELSGSGYQELMNYLLEESFNLAALKQLLLKHMNGGGSSGSLASNYGSFHEANQGLQGSRSFVHERSAGQAAASKPPVSPPPASTWAASGHPTRDRPGAEELKRSYGLDAADGVRSAALEESFATEPAKKYKLPVMLIAILGLCLAWKLYLDNPTEGWLYISAGMSILIADFVFVALWIWKWPSVAGQTREDEQNAVSRNTPIDAAVPEAILSRLTAQQQRHHQAAAEPSSSLASFLMRESASNYNEASPVVSRPDAVPELSRSSGIEHASRYGGQQPISDTDAVSPDNYYAGLDQKTTLLTETTDATVLLRDPKTPLNEQQPFLEIVVSGDMRRMPLDKTCFVIGRAGSGVDYEHNETGVSRLHAEVIRHNGTFGVKDLGSRNGTRINGETLAPYKLYPLNPGDKITIVNTDFTFKMG